MDSNSILGPKISRTGFVTDSQIERVLATTEEQRQALALIAADVVATLCFNETLALSFVGNLNTESIQSAIQNLLRQNECLRSVISNDFTLVRVLKYQQLDIRQMDLSQSVNADVQLAILQKAEIQTPFDLHHESGFRATLIKIHQEKHVLLLSVHRLLCERNALMLLVQQLAHLYNQQLQVKGVDTAELDISSQVNQSFALPINLDGYSGLCDHEHSTVWPLDFTRPEIKSYRSQKIDRTVPQHLVSKIQKYCVLKKVDLNLFFLTAFNYFTQQNFIDVNKQNDSFVQQIKQLQKFQNNINLQKEFSVLNSTFTVSKLGQNLRSIFNGLDLSVDNIARSFDLSEINLNVSIGLQDIHLSCLYRPSLYTLESIDLFLQKFIAEIELFCNEENFWQNTFQEPLPNSELPSDVMALSLNNPQTAISSFFISAEITNELQSFCEKHQITLPAMLLASFEMVLSLFSEMDTQTESSMLLQANHLAVRSVINPHISVVENIKKTYQIFRQASVYGAESLQQFIATKTVLFQNNFNYILGKSDYKHSSSGLLDLSIQSNKTILLGQFVYRSDFYSKQKIESFSQVYQYLISRLVDYADVQLAKIDLIPESQKDFLLKLGHHNITTEFNKKPIYELIVEVAHRYPNFLAIESSEGRLTYAELISQVDNFALGLLENGISRGELVGVCLSRGIESVVVLLSLFKIGAGYVPLDPVFPQDRLDYMITQTKLRAVVSEVTLANRFSSGLNILDVNDLKQDRSHHESILKKIDFNDMLSATAYVMYTSGSSGQPKGVEITQQSLSNFLQSMLLQNVCSKDDRVIAITTLSFDISILEIFLPLICGASVYIAQSKDVIDGERLKALIEEKNITLMQATPSTWRLLLSSGWIGSNKLKALCGGESFPIDLAEHLKNICSSVWNMYGPTETTVWSSCKKLSLDDQQVTLGLPIANTEFYVLDDQKRMRPFGSIGHLFIGGQGLAKGYFGRPDLTSDRFLPNPWRSKERMYATGDLVRYNKNGELIFVGRADDQVKVRGYRIELDEIQYLLQQIDGVAESTVVLQKFKSTDTRIVAYLVLNKSQTRKIDERDLRYILSQKLPAYMMPSHFVFLSKFVKTLNGKIDKKQLPKISINEEFDIQLHLASSLKESLRKMWKDVLLISEISDEDNFFDIGGNSLIAVDLYAKIQVKYKIELPLSLLIESKNFQSFVTTVESRLDLQRNSVEFHLKANQVQRFKSMVAISLDGSKNPLFCFHAVGGNVLNYVGLVPFAKAAGRPLLAFQSLSLTEPSISHQSIEDMARFYIDEMKRAQPSGPYLLAGGSMGGLIAYEVAQQLIRSGEKVEKLLMFDTVNPTFRSQSQNYIEMNSLWSRAQKSLKARFDFFKNRFKVKLYRSLDLPVPLSLLLFSVERNNYKAISKYVPKVYCGDLHLLRAPANLSAYGQDFYLGWKDLIQGNVNVHVIDADHQHFIESPDLLNTVSKLI